MSAPVKHTCPDINDVIEKSKTFVNDIIYDLEKLRKSNELLREWGNEKEEEVEELKNKIKNLEKEIEILENKINELS